MTHYGASSREVLHRRLEAEVDGLCVLTNDETPARIVTASEEEVVSVGGHSEATRKVNGAQYEKPNTRVLINLHGLHKPWLP